MLKFRRKKFLKTFITRISTFKVNSYMLITFKSPVVLKENCSVKTMMTYKWFVFALTKYLTRKWREDEFLMSGRATHSFNNNLVQTLHSSHLLTCRHNAREQKWANCIFQLKIKSEEKWRKRQKYLIFWTNMNDCIWCSFELFCCLDGFSEGRKGWLSSDACDRAAHGIFPLLLLLRTAEGCASIRILSEESIKNK